jgi:hypothetical protein
VDTMYYAVRNEGFYVETAIGIMTIEHMFQASCFETVDELIEFMQSYEIVDFEIYQVTKI